MNSDHFPVSTRISDKADEVSTMVAADPHHALHACDEDSAVGHMGDGNKILPTNRLEMLQNCSETLLVQTAEIRVDAEARRHMHDTEHGQNHPCEHSCDAEIGTGIGGNRQGNAIDVSNTANDVDDEIILGVPFGPTPPPQQQPNAFPGFSPQLDPLQVSADELAKDRMLERQQIEDDIHGTRALVEETEDFLYVKLDDMESEISSIVAKRGYEMALEINPEYAGGRPMREMFLRSAAYDPQIAAHKMTKWFDAILTHFGVEGLGRPLRLSDLTPEAYHILMIGKFQFLPKPDAAGRSVLMLFKNTIDAFSANALIQVLLYMSSSVYGCDDLQRRGVVSVHKLEVAPGTPQTHVGPSMYRIGPLNQLSPLRFEAFHYLGNQRNRRVESAAHKFQNSANGDLRNRFLIHLECDYQTSLNRLSTFGVPIQDLPFTGRASGVHVANHMHWVTKRKIAEGCGILAPNSIMRYNTCNLDQLLIRTSMSNIMAKAKTKAKIKGTTKRGKVDRGNQHGSSMSESSTCSTVSDEETSASPSTANTSRASGDDKTGNITPTDNDVLLGRGRPFLRHPANHLLRTMVADKSREYDKASRSDKYDIAKDIVAAIHKKGGRFLKLNATTGLWWEVAWGVARDKVAHAFRKRRELDLAKDRKAKARQQK